MYVRCKISRLPDRTIQTLQPSELIGREFHLDFRDGLRGVQTLGACARTWKI
jgi:hypothetical protein